MAIFIKRQSKNEFTIVPINQNEIFNDLYKLGETLSKIEIDSPYINIINWANERNIKANGKIYDTYLSLSNIFINYIYEILDNGDDCRKIENFLKKLLNKYGIPNNHKKVILVSLSHTYKEILIYSLYVYTITELLKIIKNKKNQYRTKFVYWEISNSSLFKYVQEMITVFFQAEVSIIFDSTTNYIFKNWCTVAGLKLNALVKEMNYSIDNDPKTILCKQCGFLFVQKGKEQRCSEECKRIDARLRQVKSRNRKKRNV